MRLMMKHIIASLVAMLVFLVGSNLIAQEPALPTIGNDDYFDEICMDQCFSLPDRALFTCRLDCRDSKEMKIPAGIDYLTRRMRHKIPPPLLKEVRFDPVQPVSGSPFRATLVPVEKNPEKLAEITSKFIYAFDSPADWQSTVPSFYPDTMVWEAKIDIPAEARSLISTPRLGVESGSTYIEIPCDVSGGSFKDNSCFFPLSPDESFENDPVYKLDASLDILDAYFGKDGKDYYIKLNLRGKPQPGDPSPMRANYYMVSFYDPARPTGVDPYHQTYFIIYSPVLFRGSACRLLARRAGRWGYESADLHCSAQGDSLEFVVSRSIVGKPVTGVLALYASTGVVFSDDNGVIMDFTPTTAVRIDRSPVSLDK